MADEALDIDQGQPDEQTPPPQIPPAPQPLPPDQRAKLDGIVVHMYQQNASKDEIQSVVDDFKKKYTSSIPSNVVADSHNTITGTLNSPEANAAIDKINADKYYNQIYQNQQATSSGKDATAIKQPLPIRLHSQVQQERDNYRASVQDNPDLARPVLTEIKRQNPNNPQNKSLDKAMYLSDANKRPHTPGAVQYYADQIGSGKMQYDIDKKQIVKPVGPIDAFFNGMQKHSDDMDDFKFLTTHNDDEVIDYLNKQGPVDPDKPVMKAGGALSSIAEMQGGNAVAMAKMGGPALILNPYGDVAAAFGAAIGAGAGSQDFANTAYANTLKQSYHDYLSSHPGSDPHEALKKAEDDAHISSMLAAGQGIAMTAGGVLGKETEFTPVRYSKKNLNALIDVGNNIKTLAKGAVPEIGTQAGIAGAVQAINNAHQGKDVGSGVADAAGSMALFTAGMIGLKIPGAFKGGGLSAAGRANLMDLYSKAPENAVNAGLSNAVQHEALTPQQAGELKVEINANKEATKGKPDLTASITPEGEDLIDKYKNGQLPPVPNEAIKKIAKANGIEAKEGEPDLSVEDIYNKLKYRQSAGKTPTFEDEDKNLTSGLTGIHKEMNDKDPEGFLKYIAEQAHGGEATRTELESGDGITKSLIDHATSKYPEHIIPDAKEEVPAETKTGSIPIEKEQDLRTLDYGDWKGKEESEGAQEKINKEIVNNDPIGGTGEKLMDFANRALPAARKIMDNPDENTTIVTHSSVIKALNAWDAIGRLDKIDDSNFKQFAKEYISEKPEAEGRVNSFKSDKNGTTTHVIRHGETEDNKLSEFREDNTELTEKGKAQAQAAGKELLEKTGGNIPRINTSDLPRTVATSGIILDHFNGEKPVENETVSEEDKPEVKNIKSNEEIDSETANNEKRTVGVSHESLKKIADRIGLAQPERGTLLTPEEYSDRGQTLLKAGADPDQLEADFKKDNLVNTDRVSVARAQYNKLVKDADDAYESKGKNSLEYQKAKGKADQWQKEVLKPMISEGFGGVGRASQGENDLDTGSFVSVSRAYEDKYNEAPSPTQEKHIKELTGKVKELSDKVADLEQKSIKAIDDSIGAKDKATYKEKAQAYADAFRKLKNKPFTFKDENGKDIDVHTAGVAWNDIVEAGAQIIEKTGEIADGIAAALDKAKEAGWYKNLSDKDKDKFAKQLQAHYEDNAPDIAVEKPKDPTELAKKLIDKKGNKFTPQESKDIWEYGKSNYLNKGIGFRDMIIGVSKDTGLSFDQISHAITTSKAKPITNEMWKQRYDLQKNRLATQRYLDSQGQNPAIKAFNKVVNIFREESVFGHGGVFVGTHAGMTLMDLPRMKHTVEAFFNAYKLAYGKTADYEKSMENLKNSQNYVVAQRAGLQNNPDIISNDSEVISSKLGKLSETGKRGFNAIKILRQAIFDSHYNSLSAIEKADPSSAVSIARLVNNATGATNLALPPWFKEVTFAGGMEAARWGKLTKNPLEATSTALKALFDPKNTSIGDRVFAKVWARRVGSELATFSGLLVLNSAIQNHVNGGKNNVNLTDPTKSDWLKMKIGNTTLDFTSGMLSTLNFAKQMVYQPLSKSKENIIAKEGETVFKYGTGKFSPFYATATEALLKHDYSGNTMPWSDAKPLHSYNHNLTWEEYGESKLPLPIAEGFNAYYESAHQNGMSKSKIDNILTGLQYGAISGTTGFRAYETSQQEESKKGETRK